MTVDTTRQAPCLYLVHSVSGDDAKAKQPGTNWGGADDDARFEKSGEHSWLIAHHAWALAEHAHADVQIDRVIRMLLIHDIVEIDEAQIAADEARVGQKVRRVAPALWEWIRPRIQAYFDAL